MSGSRKPGIAEIGALLNDGRSQEAAELAGRLCVETPLDAHAWYLQAAAHSMLGHWQEVAACCRKVVALEPGHAEAHYNLGAALASLGDFPEAIVSFQRVLQLRPDFADAHLALGSVYQGLGRLADAGRHLEAALARNPGNADAHGRLGAVLAAAGRWQDSVRAFERLLALEPRHLSGLVNYGASLKAAGRLDDAAAAYRKALALHPDSDLARYFVATLGGDDVPARSPDAYVRDLFDDYAGRFEKHLVTTLRYQMPDHIARALREILGGDAGGLEILDLGCGTGLAGLAVRSLARRLVGVDISSRMIEQSRQKNLYDELHVAELGAYLATDPATYDIVIAADVLIYIGDLAPVIDGVARLLKPGGILAFSVERHDGTEPYVLRSSGRYAHAAEWIRSRARAAGLHEVRAEEQVVRVEAGIPIHGWLFVFQGPPD